jgi:hypothetical protein
MDKWKKCYFWSEWYSSSGYTPCCGYCTPDERKGWTISEADCASCPNFVLARMMPETTSLVARALASEETTIEEYKAVIDEIYRKLFALYDKHKKFKD